MIYLIGGPAKVGKSKLAKRLLMERNIAGISTDVFIEVLKENRLGEFNAAERATQFFPFFTSLLRQLPGFYTDYWIEGNAFMPEHVRAIEEKGGAKYRVCFLGMSEARIDLILKHAGPATWLMTDLTEAQRNEYPRWLVKTSEEIRRQCELYGYRYFDLAGDYETNLEQAYRFLVA